MTRLAAITKQQHAGKSWTRFTSYDFASKDCIAPLVGAEISKVVLDLPMAFVKQRGNFLLVAVLSLTPGTNLYVAPTGQWLGGYVPSVFRGYPFRLARGGEKKELMLCVDEDSGLVNEDRAVGEPFFDDSGEISKPVKDILKFLSQIEKGRAATAEAVAALVEMGMLVEWPLKIKMGEEDKPVTGLYQIDEAKLHSLADDQFLQLRKVQALAIAYAQLLSMGNILKLEKIAKLRRQMKPKDPDITAAFGDDDIITFQ